MPLEGRNTKETIEMAAFIKFDGVDGEAQDSEHKAWSDLVSLNQEIYKPSAGTGPTRRRGDAVLEDIQVAKELDKSSPKLAEAVCKGKVFPKVDIHFTASYTDSGRTTYYAYELKNVSVSSYSVSGAGSSEDVPVESLSLNFEEIKVTYTETDATGSKKGNVEYQWKVEEGE
jgi:type VI secretion system secreted protein Hcp